MDTEEEIRFKKPMVVNHVDAPGGILGLVKGLAGEDIARWLGIELTEKAIPWVVKELYQALPSNETYEQFETSFREGMKQGIHQHGYVWKYWSCDMDRGDICIMVMPVEKTTFFEIVTNSEGDAIIIFRQIEYR